MKRLLMMVAAFCAVACAVHAETITCGGDGPYHLQGVACDGSSIYWCYTTRLVKTDLTGAQLAAVDVPGHSGDLCVHLGKVYVATEEGRYVRESNFKQEVRVYDAATLNLLKKYNIDADCVPRGFLSSGIEYANGRFWLAVGLEENVVDEKNYVLEYTPSFDLVAVHELETGNTQYGIQTIAYHGGKFFLGTYAGTSGAAGSFVCDSNVRGAVRVGIGGSEGLMSVTGVLYRAVSTQNKTTGRWTATATSVDRLDRLYYSVNGASGSLVDTPPELIDFGFLPKSRYYGGADTNFTASGTENGNLIANATASGGKVITLAAGAQNAYAGGIAVASGTLEVPSAAAIDAPKGKPDAYRDREVAPIVLSSGTLRFNGGGTMARDVVIYPFSGMEKAAAIIDVAAGATVTNAGRFSWTDGTGNFLKTGEGTLVVATPNGEAVVTNHIGSAGVFNEQWKSTIPLADMPNGDGPARATPAFGVLNGRLVIATAPEVVTILGHNAMVGGPTTRDGVETAGHLDIYSGDVRCNGGLFAIGRDNGTSVTAPGGLSSTMNLYGGSFTCAELEMSYISYQDSVSTCRPVLNIHGGTFTITDRIRIAYAQAYATINIDGGLLTMNRFHNALYSPGAHFEINISNGGTMRTTEFNPAVKSTADAPTYMRVNVTDGGVFAMKTIPSSAGSVSRDARFCFNGGVLHSLQTTYTDEVPSYMPVDVGEKGMTIDITEGTHWGLQMNSPIAAASGVTDGGIKVVNTSGTANHWIAFNGGVNLAGGITAEDVCHVMVGGDVHTPITFKKSGSWLRVATNATVDSVTFEQGTINYYSIGMSGNTGDAGVHAYILTANAFTPPPGRIMAYAYRGTSTTYSEPFGTFPFLRVPVSSPLTAANFVYRQESTDTHTYYFTQTVADGWRTISWVHEATDSRTHADPRASGDWLSGSGGVFELGPWLLNYAGSGTTANFMYSGIPASQSCGISVADSLTLAGGAQIRSAPFVKLGPGTLTLAGDATYSFGASYSTTMPYTDQSCWNLFDMDGNSVTGHQAGVIVDEGRLTLGTGSDCPTLRYPSGNEFWVGSVTTTAAGGEKDAAMEVESGVLSMSGTFVVGRNRGTPETAAHEPLVSTYEQSGGDATVGLLIVGYKNGATAAQQDSFTLNGGHFTANNAVRVGQCDKPTGVGTNYASLVINDGVFESGKTAYGTSTEGRLIVNFSAQTNKFTTFEMNGGEAKLWCDLVCWKADPDFRTQVRLNGGTILFGGQNNDAPKFDGGNNSELHWNGTVLKPYVPNYRTSIGPMFNYYAVREIGPNGAIFDLSEANVDHVEPFANDSKDGRDFTGTGDIIVRGGDTNRCLRLSYNLSCTGDLIAEKGGVMEVWHGHNGSDYTYFGINKTVRVRDGGGVCSYYTREIGNLYLGETAADNTFVYGYGFAGYDPVVAGTLLQIKGTVHCAWRASGYGNPLRVPKGTYAILRGPKGSFADVDVANQFKVHPKLVKPGVTVTFALNTANANYDEVRLTASDDSYYGPVHPAQPVAGKTNVFDSASNPISGTFTFYGETQPQMQQAYTSGGGTVKLSGPLSGNGTIKLTSGRIEGRPEEFNGVTLDPNNATVRFTESGTSTVNIKNTSTGGIGLEVAEGKTVYVTGTFTNNSALVKMDPGTLVLQSNMEFTRASGAAKNPDTGWSTLPTNGDVPNAQSLSVNAGTLVFDMPGKAVVANGTNAKVWVGNHPIPDGHGGAYPAVLEVWQGELHQTNEILCVGRYVDNSFDSCSKFSTRPYIAVNLRGGTIRSEGLIMGYSNYKYTHCGLYELNIYDGLFEVGKLRVAIPHDASNVKCGDDECESVLNIYGGTFRKLAGDHFALGGYYGSCVSGKTYPARGTINVYGGLLETAASTVIEVPYLQNSVATVNLYGGVVVTKNFKRTNTSANALGYVNFDGGTFCPLENGGTLSGFTAVTVGEGGGTIALTNGNTYTVSQLAKAAALGAEDDGGFGASGDGTLFMNVANGYTGPTRVSGSATFMQGVANAFSDTVELDGGTLNLNGLATTFRTVKGHGTIVGDCTVTEGMEIEGTLNFNGNLTLGNGATVRMEVEDDGSAVDQLNVTGTLASGGNVTFDFGRYDDLAFISEFKTAIGTVGGGVFRAQAAHVTTGNMLAGVHAVNGQIVLDVHPRGSMIIMR